MKNTVLALAIALALAGCKDKSKFIIEGKFEHAGEDRKVYLFGMGNSNMQVLDSTVLSESGEFKFTKDAPEADFYRVNIGANEYMLIAKNGDKVKIEADLDSKAMDYKISGAEDAEKLIAFNELKSGYAKKIDAIRQDFEAQVAAHPEKRQQLVDQISPKYNEAIDALNAAILKFALDNSSSLASFYAISLVNTTGNEQGLIKYAEAVSEDLKKNTAIKSFVEKVNKLKTVQVGQKAPDFSIQGLDGNTIALKDFQGKYVLIDFWASWCAPCREENPNVVKAYNQFKDRNFTILGISLDKDKKAWQQAIAQDGLTWTHASELADFEGKTVRLYQVDAIPNSYLIGPDGTILAHNLRGEELMSFLNKTLPSK